MASSDCTKGNIQLVLFCSLFFALVCSCLVVIIIKSSSGQDTHTASSIEAIKEEVKRQVGRICDPQIIKKELLRELKKEQQEHGKQVEDFMINMIKQLEEVKLTLSSLQIKYGKHLDKKLNQLEAKCDRCHQNTTTEPAGWSLWDSWTPCSSSCGSGTRTRSRTCNSPTKQGTCQGESDETKQCQGHDCAELTGWSPWDSWTPCSSSCGSGTRTRSRTCNRPTKQGTCQGESDEKQQCQGHDCAALTRMSQPVLDLNLTITSPQLTRIVGVAALPGGEAVVEVLLSTGQIIKKINQNGQPVQHLYESNCVYSMCTIDGLLELGRDIFIIYPNGKVVRVNHQNGRVVHVYHIQNVSYVYHQGSLSSNPALIEDKDLLLLADLDKGEVFTYRLSTEQKVVRLTGLSEPVSVSYLYSQQAVYYVVCESRSNTVGVYNSTWSRVSTMPRSSQITLSVPYAAVTSPEQTILVADYVNDRIVEFSKEGEFIGHLISVRNPRMLSISFPHVWVVSYYGSGRKLYRYRIYKN